MITEILCECISEDFAVFIYYTVRKPISEFCVTQVSGE